MTTSDEELVKQLRGNGWHYTAAEIMSRAADTITRLTREKAEARAQGAEEMRESAAKVADNYEKEAREVVLRFKTDAYSPVAAKSVAAKHLAIMIRALPLPSPVAAQAVPEAKERYQHYKGGIYEVLHQGAYLEWDQRRCVIYRHTETSKTWVRPFDEFHGFVSGVGSQKRFALLPSTAGE